MTTPIDRVLVLVQGARQSARGWTARCPHHHDRSPSLSVSVGRDGTVLLRCFAGCDVTSICAALGLSVRDLFVSDDSRARANALHRDVRMRYRRAPRATIAAFMDHEIERQRQLRVAREPFDTPQIRSADVNAARRRAAAIFDTRLDPIARYEWEGWHPNDTDPLWPVLFARARDEVSWIQPTAAVPTLSLLAADLAHEWLRAIARATPTMRREKVV